MALAAATPFWGRGGVGDGDGLVTLALRFTRGRDGAATAALSAVRRAAASAAIAADLKNVYSNINAEWRAKGNFNLRGAAPKCEIPNFGRADLSVHA